jgi:hypothetical protein
VFAGGSTSINVIQYITISAPGNAVDFGDLTSDRYAMAGVSNGENNRGVFAGEASPPSTDIDYIAINSPGNAADFGNLTQARGYAASASNGTSDRGLFAGGYTGSVSNVMDYITISSTGNATDFGDLTTELYAPAGTSNSINDRAVIAGGRLLGPSPHTAYNNIEYVTISVTSNTSDFGDLTVARSQHAGTSNGIYNRGVFAGGQLPNQSATNTMDYIEIPTTANALDFGDLAPSRYGVVGTSNA